jgi:NitT/TauT family transport system permease protein
MSGTAASRGSPGAQRTRPPRSAGPGAGQLDTGAPPTSDGAGKAAAILRRTRTADAARRRRDLLLVNGGTVLLGVLLLVFWEFGAGLVVNRRYVSSPSAVLAELARLVGEGTLWPHLSATMLEATAGYLIGVALGLLGAYAATRSQTFEEVIDPFLRAFYSIPKIALAPLFIMWFGLGYTPKILLAALMVLFVVLVNTIAGIKGIPPGLVSTARVLGAGDWSLARKVVLPAAAPAIMASIRICFARAMVGAILAELIAARSGLGLLIARSSRQFETATVFAGILVIAVLVMSVNGLIRLVERKAMPWSTGAVHG